VPGPHAAADLQAFAECQFAVRKRAFDGLVYLGHAPEDRQAQAA
jgi:hypothetical protein